MGQGINWDLVKVDWRMVVDAMLEKGRQQTAVNTAAIAASAQNNATAQRGRESQMQNQLGQQRIAADTKIAGMKLQADQNQFNQGMNLQKMKMAQEADKNNFQKVRDMMALQIQADASAAVLKSKDKQLSWKMYTDAVMKLGQDPMKLGLPVSYNKDANDFLKTQLSSAVEGLKHQMSPNSLPGRKTTNPLAVDSSTPEGKAQLEMNKQSFKSDIEHINEGRKNIASFNNFLGQVPAVQKAAEDFDKYSLTGMGLAGKLGKVAAEAGAGISDNQSKAAAAGGVIDQWGQTVALLKKSLMPGSMSDSDRDLLMGLSVNTGMPKEEFGEKLNMIQGFMQRSIQEQSFKEMYLSQNGTLSGADAAWGRFMMEHPVVDPSTRELTGDNNFTPYLGDAMVSNEAQKVQEGQRSILNQPPNMYGPTTDKNPYM